MRRTKNRVRPILFNTSMVRAINYGHKTASRRAIRPMYCNTHLEMRTDKYGTRLIEIQNSIEGETFGKCENGASWFKVRGHIEPKPQYKRDDILYVRETWAHIPCIDCRNAECEKMPVTYESGDTVAEGCFIYRSDYSHPERIVWSPCLHMPRQAARTWLRVTGVKVERLQDMSDADCMAEGIRAWTKDGRLYKYYPADAEGDFPDCPWDECPRTPKEAMKKIWDGTIRKSDIDIYGWDANPWVWVYEFEKCGKPAE